MQESLDWGVPVVLMISIHLPEKGLYLLYKIYMAKQNHKSNT